MRASPVPSVARELVDECTSNSFRAREFCRKTVVGGGLPGLGGFSVVFYRALLTHYTLSGERVHHTQTLLPNTRLVRPACYTMATFSGFCLRAFAASRLESAVKKVGGSGGDRDGGGGIRVGDAEVCAHVCAWGALHAADQAGRWGGIGRRRQRQGQGQWRCPGMVATAASGMQPARRGGRWARPLRAARVRTTKQLWMQPW